MRIDNCWEKRGMLLVHHLESMRSHSMYSHHDSIHRLHHSIDLTAFSRRPLLPTCSPNLEEFHAKLASMWLASVLRILVECREKVMTISNDWNRKLHQHQSWKWERKTSWEFLYNVQCVKNVAELYRSVAESESLFITNGNGSAMERAIRRSNILSNERKHPKNDE